MSQTNIPHSRLEIVFYVMQILPMLFAGLFVIEMLFELRQFSSWFMLLMFLYGCFGYYKLALKRELSGYWIQVACFGPLLIMLFALACMILYEPNPALDVDEYERAMVNYPNGAILCGIVCGLVGIAVIALVYYWVLQVKVNGESVWKQMAATESAVSIRAKQIMFVFFSVIASFLAYTF